MKICKKQKCFRKKIGSKDFECPCKPKLLEPRSYSSLTLDTTVFLHFKTEMLKLRGQDP